MLGQALWLLCLWRPAGNRTSKRQVCLEGYSARPFLLTISQVSGTKESTELFLKLKVFMPMIKLISTWARDMFICIKQKKKKKIATLVVANQTKPEWYLGKGVARAHANSNKLHSEFRSNLPTNVTWHKICVMLYPSRFKLIKST